jgi:hypothetical protein
MKTEIEIAPTLEVGQLYRSKGENPFEVLFARIKEIRGEWVQYSLSRDGTEATFFGAMGSDKISGFLNRYKPAEGSS